MPKLQDYTVYTPDNQIADLAERQGMTVHLIDGPTQHVLREAHTVYLFGSYTALRDMSETEHVTELASSLGKELLLCDVTTGQRPDLHSALDLDLSGASSTQCRLGHPFPAAAPHATESDVMGCGPWDGVTL